MGTSLDSFKASIKQTVNVYNQSTLERKFLNILLFSIFFFLDFLVQTMQTNDKNHFRNVDIKNEPL